MRLNNNTKTIIFGNVHLINYCKNAGIDTNKLKKCEIEKMGNIYVFVLSKENTPKSTCMIPLDVDIATQPDIVLTMEVTENEKYKFETTAKTVRLLNK